MSKDGRKYPVANPIIVLREEFDDWAVLFDPDSGAGYGLNPVGCCIYKLLDGKHTEDDIFTVIEESFNNVPAEATEHVNELIRDLVARGFAGYEV